MDGIQWRLVPGHHSAIHDSKTKNLEISIMPGFVHIWQWFRFHLNQVKT
jgi:hypothetical protein